MVRPMGTTAYGGKGSKGRAANGDRPVGSASCRREQHTMAPCQNPLFLPQYICLTVAIILRNACCAAPPPPPPTRWA